MKTQSRNTEEKGPSESLPSQTDIIGTVHRFELTNHVQLRGERLKITQQFCYLLERKTIRDNSSSPMSFLLLLQSLYIHCCDQFAFKKLSVAFRELSGAAQ